MKFANGAGNDSVVSGCQILINLNVKSSVAKLLQASERYKSAFQTMRTPPLLARLFWEHPCAVTRNDVNQTLAIHFNASDHCTSDMNI